MNGTPIDRTHYCLNCETNAREAERLKAENERLRELLTRFASIGDPSYYTTRPSRLDVPFEWCENAFYVVGDKP